jgi:hypothetical protein
VDLTFWRANVLFELGVRLAVRAGGTFCLIDGSAEEPSIDAHTRSTLFRLLQPATYTIETDTFPRRLSGADRPRNAIYEAALRHFRHAQDRLAEPVETTLLRTDAITSGVRDPLQAVDLTPLYARDNPVYGSELRHAVFERLCAAWFYLADRARLGDTRPIDLLDPQRAEAFRGFRRLGSRLRAALAHRYGARDARLRRRIDASDRRASRRGTIAMADLIDAWTALREDPPWRIPLASVAPEDRDAQLADWDEQGQRLLALEERLTGLANPVCELPLQSIRLDRARLDAVRREAEGAWHG